MLMFGNYVPVTALAAYGSVEYSVISETWFPVADFASLLIIFRYMSKMTKIWIQNYCYSHMPWYQAWCKIPLWATVSCLVENAFLKRKLPDFKSFKPPKTFTEWFCREHGWPDGCTNPCKSALRAKLVFVSSEELTTNCRKWWSPVQHDTSTHCIGIVILE